MNTSEFNEKWSKYLEKGHYGLDIPDDKVIEYLDKKFEELSKIEGFLYSQIKTKFNFVRVYMEPRSINTTEIEEEIKNLLKS